MTFSAAGAQPAAVPQKVQLDGVSVEMVTGDAVADRAVPLRFRVRGSDGRHLNGVRPSAWIDVHEQKAGSQCKEKIQSFLSGSLRARPVVDLNSYTILTLNAEASVAVIDPLLGFGGSKLLTAVTLDSPGVDWALSPDQHRLFVTMPLVNRVAVIDTESWEVIKNVETPFRPARVLFDANGRLWVTHENRKANEPSLSAIDAQSLEVVARLSTGLSPHQLAIAPNGEQLLITNGGSGNVSIVDLATRAKTGELVTGPSPSGVATSSLSDALYVIDEQDGSISVIDAKAAKLRRRIEAKPGLGTIAFAPGGRWGFVTNPDANQVLVLDSSTNAIIATLTDIGTHPDQIAFTDDYAYIRAAGSDSVKLLPLSTLGSDANGHIASFPAGQIPPGAVDSVGFAAAIVPSPEPKAVIVANPADRLVYYYMEGMAAPMGNFAAAKRSPKAALVLDRSLRESEPGDFTIRTKIPEAGHYDVAFFLDSPRVIHCFDLAVKANPDAPKKLAAREIAVHPILDKKPIVAGNELEMRFRLTDSTQPTPLTGVRDVRAVAFGTSGAWQERFKAEPAEDGTYRVHFAPPQPGIYYVFLESKALGLKVNQTRPLIFEAVAQ
ncbi:MAG: YncE family protein [Acidobacteria bacterium]|nr:YncE family protein [Acidobacteriota bacterium]